MARLQPRLHRCTKRAAECLRLLLADEVHSGSRRSSSGGFPLRPIRRAGGLTLIELLMTIAILGILAAILIPQFTSDLPDRLNAGAQVVSADFDYARSLAVSNNSSYLVTFDTANNLYFLRHSGANGQFNTLPPSPFRQTDDPVDKQTTKLSALPFPEPGIRLAAVVQMQGSAQATTSLEFTPLGGTTSTNPTVVWLSCGGGATQRFISIAVDPVTGLVSIGPPVSALPMGVTAAQNGAAQSGS